MCPELRGFRDVQMDVPRYWRRRRKFRCAFERGLELPRFLPSALCSLELQSDGMVRFMSKTEIEMIENMINIMKSAGIDVAEFAKKLAELQKEVSG